MGKDEEAWGYVREANWRNRLMIFMIITQQYMPLNHPAHARVLYAP